MGGGFGAGFEGRVVGKKVLEGVQTASVCAQHNLIQFKVVLPPFFLKSEY